MIQIKVLGVKDLKFISQANLKHCRLWNSAALLRKISIKYEAENAPGLESLCDWTKI